MRLMDHDLARLVKEKTVALADAMLKARSRKDLEQMVGVALAPPGAAPAAAAGAGATPAASRETTKSYRVPS